MKLYNGFQAQPQLCSPVQVACRFEEVSSHGTSLLGNLNRTVAKPIIAQSWIDHTPAVQCRIRWRQGGKRKQSHRVSLCKWVKSFELAHRCAHIAVVGAGWWSQGWHLPQLSRNYRATHSFQQLSWHFLISVVRSHRPSMTCVIRNPHSNSGHSKILKSLRLSSPAKLLAAACLETERIFKGSATLCWRLGILNLLSKMI